MIYVQFFGIELEFDPRFSRWNFLGKIKTAETFFLHHLVYDRAKKIGLPALHFMIRCKVVAVQCEEKNVMAFGEIPLDRPDANAQERGYVGLVENRLVVPGIRESHHKRH